MSGRRYSGRHYRRRRSPVPGILLLIVAAALVLGALAIFTDVFKKDRPADRADDPAVTQPDDTQKPDDAQQPSGGADGQDGQTGGDTQQPDNSGSQTGSKTLDTITTDATPYQSGGVYIVGDTGFEMYNYVDSLAKNYGEIVTSVADQLSGVSTVYALAVPLSSGITLPDALYSDIPGSDQAQAEKDILAAMGKNVKTVPLHDVMMSHRGEYIYFRTDHHWTARGAYEAYIAFCKSAGLTPVSLEEMEHQQIDGFLGTFYSQTHDSQLAQTPDFVEYFVPPVQTTTTRYQTGAPFTPIDSSIFASYATGGQNTYSVFLHGDFPLTHIQTDNRTGRKILLVKESYGNAFAPFLACNFDEVYIVDQRYFELGLVDFVKEHGITDLLFLNNIFAVNTDVRIRELSRIQNQRYQPISQQPVQQPTQQTQEIEKEAEEQREEMSNQSKEQAEKQENETPSKPSKTGEVPRRLGRRE